jgi:8-oxo-dGTP diphosphatase
MAQGVAMAREPVLAAGGIVVRRGASLQIAVVKLRKRNEWVLPKGKLNAGETARAAAEREVLEETGHGVAVHEFLGTMAYQIGARSKIVHFWRMEADAAPSRDLMRDVRAVDWLSLDAALERLSRGYEREFLAHVGPTAMLAAAGVIDVADAPALSAEEVAGERIAPPPSPLRKAWLWLRAMLER